MEPSTSSVQKVRNQRDTVIQTVVGFEDDARRLVEQLMGGKKQLQFISVVGMAGLGKTTLVRKVFDEPSVVYHFYVRAWTTVTQEPKKRDLILAILKSGFNAGNKDISDMELSVTLKRRLSGQRYLIVMDDTWDSEDWNDLMLCFPDDNVGSRIVFTTRLADVPLQVQPGCYQHPLRFSTDDESWDLLQYKVFLNGRCPSSLVDIGKQVAKKCHGLPLSVVVIAGILASDTTTIWWSQVAQDMSTIASNAPEQYMDTLVLSYNHLPDHLKPCFLYFAAFPEDYEIPAWKLILLWVAEGFINTQTAKNNLEDEGNNSEEVAARYLKDLISRSLIMVSKSGSNGEIKACIIHDVLHDFCIKKADEVNFLNQIPRYQQYASKSEIPTSSKVQRFYSREGNEQNFTCQLIRYFRVETAPQCKVHKFNIHIASSFKRSRKNIPATKYISTKTLYLNVQAILCFTGLDNSFSEIRYCSDNLCGVFRLFKMLRVMDLSSVGLSKIPVIIGSLVELRYIALCIKAGDNHYADHSFSLPTSIYKLKYLQTLIVHNINEDGILVPSEIWTAYSLRHLVLKGNIAKPNKNTQYSYPPEKLQTLLQLQTLLHRIPLEDCEKILEITPNLRKLGINADLYLSSTTLMISNLNKLQHLENLCLQNDLNSGIPLKDKLYRQLSNESMFPVTLKKLTLVCTFLKWDEMQKIGMLPNLEVLKLHCEAFHGDKWETNDGGFKRLKHLAFKFMRIVQWSAYSEQFPKLEHLKLDECQQLEEIPISIGDIYTLEKIEIRNCRPNVARSADKI